ncbi:MAG TPA: FAD-dependent oxidoreductase, partial [Pirellulales bacterium]|nr:FAD-dependent oxidoreductase [Pirellulales bacterium]
AQFGGWPAAALIWETARPYFYARQTSDCRAIIGGQDTAFASDHRRDGLLQRQVQRLQRRFERLFPAIEFRPAYAWSGVFGESKDGLAYIGQTLERPRSLFCRRLWRQRHYVQHDRRPADHRPVLGEAEPRRRGFSLWALAWALAGGFLTFSSGASAGPAKTAPSG